MERAYMLVREKKFLGVSVLGIGVRFDSEIIPSGCQIKSVLILNDHHEIVEYTDDFYFTLHEDAMLWQKGIEYAKAVLGGARPQKPKPEELL